MEPESNKSNAKWLWIAVVLIVVIGIIVAWYFLMGSGKNEKSSKETTTEQTVPKTPLKEFLLWGRNQSKKRYCILIFIEDVVKIDSFNIDKTGYGISSAWLAVGNISSVKI